MQNKTTGARKILSFVTSALLTVTGLFGIATPAQATGLSVTFPTGVEDQFTPNTWQTVATVTQVTPAITGTVSPNQVRVTVSAGNSGFLRIDTTGVAAAHGYNLTNFTLANNTGAGTISFTGTVAQASTALATLQFRKVAAGGSEITVRVSQGAGVVFGDRYYEVVNVGSNITWLDALKAAASTKVASSVAGVECQGYLVTVESAQEQAFLADAVRSDSWLGASDEFNQVNASQSTVYADQATSEGRFHWVNGPSRGTQLTTANGTSSVAPGLSPNVYNNWNSTGGTSSFEPNNAATNEHYAQLLSSGLWNDLAVNGNVSQYVVEYGGLIATGSFQANPANVQFTVPAHMGTVGTCVPAAASQSVTTSFIASTAAASYNAANQDLDFNKATQVIGGVRSAQLTQNSTGVTGTTVTSGTADLGVAFGVNDFVDYYDIITIGGVQIDARVKVTAADGIESANNAANNRIEEIDGYESTDLVENRWMRTSQTFASGTGDAYVEYTIEFFVDLAAAPVPVALENFKLSVYDIDGYQYFEASEFDRYSLGQGTILTTSAPRLGVTRFAETANINSNSANMNSRATVEFDSVSSFVVRLGQNPPVNAPQGSASYALDFGLGVSWGGAQLTPVAPPAFNPAAAPYEGPVLGTFSDRNLDPCTPKSITITGTKLSGAKGSIQGKAVTVLENTDTKLVIATPAGLTPARGVDLVITSPYGTLTHQNAFDIPAGVCSQTLSKGRWTQIQSDGKTVKMYAKDPIGDGKIQFFVDGKELAWITAVDATDPKLSFASSFPYLVRSVDLKPGKNRFEIRVDGKRVWRATYVPRG